jgi:hypothetical protein
MNVLQTTSSSTTPLFDMTMSYRIHFPDNNTQIIRLHQSQNFEQFVIPVNQPVLSIQVDPDNWTLEKVNSLIVGVPDHANPAYFTFGPNPASNKIAIYCPQAPQNELKMELCDLSGKIILSEQINNTQQNIALDQLAKGTYLLRVTNDSQRWTRKLIKN